MGRVREGILGRRGAVELGLIRVGGSDEQVTDHEQEQGVAMNMAGVLDRT